MSVINDFVYQFFYHYEISQMTRRKGTKIESKSIPYLFDTKNRRKINRNLKKDRQEFWKSNGIKENSSRIEDSSDDDTIWEDEVNKETDGEVKSVDIDDGRSGEDDANMKYDTESSRSIQVSSASKRKGIHRVSPKVTKKKRLDNEAANGSFEVMEESKGLLENEILQADFGASDVSSVGDSSSSDEASINASVNTRKKGNDKNNYLEASPVSSNELSSDESASAKDESDNDSNGEDEGIGNLDVSTLQNNQSNPDRVRRVFKRERDEDSSDEH